MEMKSDFVVTHVLRTRKLPWKVLDLNSSFYKWVNCGRENSNGFIVKGALAWKEVDSCKEESGQVRPNAPPSLLPAWLFHQGVWPFLPAGAPQHSIISTLRVLPFSKHWVTVVKTETEVPAWGEQRNLPLPKALLCIATS